MRYLKTLIESGNIAELFSFSRGSTIFLIGCAGIVLCIVIAIVAAIVEHHRLRKLEQEIQSSYTESS